ncbi:hypothetical protein JTB14_033662 [Gonioctena quinquepunctata]|nr:hypothetical protein JTB14_033662 [Gonioctena quinquepunctata]
MNVLSTPNFIFGYVAKTVYQCYIASCISVEKTVPGCAFSQESADLPSSAVNEREISSAVEDIDDVFIPECSGRPSEVSNYSPEKVPRKCDETSLKTAPEIPGIMPSTTKSIEEAIKTIYFEPRL